MPTAFSPSPATDSVLAHIFRGTHVESSHRGQVVVADVEGRIHWQTPGLDGERPVFFRSAAKPLQALPMVEGGAAAAFRVSDRQLAVVCASHSGEAGHVAAVAALLAKGRLGPGCLRCGTHLPYAPAVAAALARAGKKPGPLCHNCSGKHAGMLLTCRHLGWPLATYLLPQHPLQRAIRRVVAEFADLATSAVAAGKDGCNLPAFAVSLPRMAMTYARLAAPDYWRARGQPVRAAAVARITGAMRRYPWMVSGTGRSDLALMSVAQGALFSKIGAEAVWCVGFPERGLGLAIKITDGANRAEGVILAEALRQTGLLRPAVRRRFLARTAKPITSTDGSVVGRTVATVLLQRGRRLQAGH